MTEPSAGVPAQIITVTVNLDSEPAYAEQLGHICVAWAKLEWHLYVLFEKICGSPPAIASRIFYSIESSRGRREMLWSTASVLLEKTSDKSTLEDILRRIGRTSSQRNKYVHDTWGVALTQGHEIFQMRASKDKPSRIMEQVTIPDMKAATAQINKLAEELNSFRESIISSLPALLEKFRALPSLGLEYAPKGLPPGRKPKGFHGRR